MTKRAAIFDMDGVLIDSYEAHFESWRVVAAREGIEVSREAFHASFGRTNREVIPMLWGRDDLDEVRIEAIGNAKEEAFRAALATSWPEMPGVRELLSGLKSDGWRVAVASSGPPENVRVTVEHFEAVVQTTSEAVFDAVVTAADVTRGKPDPQVFQIAAEKVGVPPARCVVIEDAAAGLRAAKSAGMACAVVVSTGHSPAEYEGLGSDLTVDRLGVLTAAKLGGLIDAESPVNRP